MATLRLNPLIHQTRRVNPRSRHELQKQGVSALNYSKISSVGVFCTFRTRVSIRASSVETFVETSESAEVLFAETFSLKRTETVEGKVSVRLKNGKDNRNWQLTVGCTLPGKWVLHWGVTYCGDLGSEWDQPPREMIPSGSIPIKGYAIETPLKQSPSGVEGQMLHEVRIDCSRDNSISAINFVLKEEETGAWFQHRGRDFRVHLTDYIQGNDGVVDDKKGFSIWSGTLFPPNLSQMSNMLLKTQGSQSNEKDNAIGSNDAKQQNIRVEGFYEEYSILKEIPVQNFLTVSVRKSEEKDKSLVFFDTDLHGDVVIHWGVCRDSDKKWEIPLAPHPPKTLIYRHKALQTLLQPKGNANGSRGSFSLDKEFVGLLFVLKINEYTYLNNMGSDFYIPILAKSSEAAQTGRNLMEGENIQSGITVDSEQGNIKEGSGPSLIEESEQENQLTNGIISEIRNLISDISSVKSRKTKSKEDQESILQEIEKLAAEAYSIFRSSLPMFVEPASSAQTLLPRKLSSGTGSGYEVLCQGFNWESHKSERWYCDLYEKAAEISSLGFTIIWLPPPTESVSPEGYMPKDLYNLNSRYGSMEELKHLVKRFHEMGVKVLGDVVLNHRCASYKNQNGVWNLFGGRLNWDDRAIVADDPHFQGRGNKGSGDNFHAAPNIDHSQDFVRNDIKEWLQWLRKEIGYDGWRLDFARGFWGGYVKDYLDASEPYFAVGEYWDSLNYTYGDMDHNQDAHRQRIVDWINATNGTAGAFDVTTKGILHSALEKCEYWRLSDEKGKPPGVVGWWPSRAVTFIENHDTGSTQGHWRFPPGKEMQGYAYILTHPGTPAVFYDHIFSHYREEIFSLISLRHRAKIHCRSASLPQPIRDEASSHPEYISQYILRKPEISDPVKITKAERDVYAAHIEGKLAMKIGPGHYEPSNGSQIWVLAAEGRDYKVWLAS